MARRASNLRLENARIIFKNFSGRASDYNREGDRNFCVILEDDNNIEDIVRDGWNVRVLRPRDEEELPTKYIPVKVSFNNYPPNVWMVSSSAKTALDEETIESLDNMDIKYADLILSPYSWEIGGRSGISAYLKTGYFVIDEDDFAQKYQ